MGRGKAGRRTLDTLHTVLGYVLLGVGIYFIWLGIGIIVFRSPAPDCELDKWMKWVEAAGAVLCLGIGAGLLGVAWWLSGEPIRRWWWRRTGRTGEPTSRG